MSQSNSSVPSRLSYAGAAARLAPTKITHIPTASLKSSAPPQQIEEYPSLVPNKPQPPVTNSNGWKPPSPPTSETTSAKFNESISPRRWETAAQVVTASASPVNSASEPSAVSASLKLTVEPLNVESPVKNGVVVNETVESPADPAGQPVPPPTEPLVENKDVCASAVSSSSSQHPKCWADLLKEKQEVEPVQTDGDIQQQQSHCQKVPEIALGSGDNCSVVPELSSSLQETPTFSSEEFSRIDRMEAESGDAQSQTTIYPKVQKRYVHKPEKMYGMPQPPMMYPMSPQYGFMLPQYAPVPQPMPYFYHPQAFFQPDMIQMSYPTPPMQNYYSPTAAVIAEPMMDGSTRFLYPEQIDQGPPPYSQVAPPTPNRRDDNWNTAVERLERETKIREKVGLLIGGRYRVVQKINMGSCGSIYTALDEQSEGSTLVAVKFETYKDRESHLIHEYEVYQACSTYMDDNNVFQGTPREGFAQVLFMGVEYGYRILVMELLGPSLENLFGYSFSRFTPETTYKLGMQMIDRIEQLHNCGFIHRDMKPDNFVMGLREQEETVYLLDFGLTRKFQANRQNEANYRKGKGVVGTAKYASINSHNGLELARRDDLESIAYILLEFITGDVPWKERGRKTKQTSYNRMRQIKEELQWKVVCPALAPWIEYVLKLGFNEKPDYDVLRNVLRRYVENPQQSGKTPLLEHLAHLTDGTDFQRRQRNGQRQRKAAAKAKTEEVSQTVLTVEERLQQSKFEWIQRRESSANETYTYECLFLWTLPYGKEPTRPTDINPSMKFGYGFGEGGFA